MDIELMADSEMVGILDNEGGIITAPKLDVFGQAFEKTNASYRYLRVGEKRYYVAIPTGKDHESLKISIRSENVPPAPAQRVYVKGDKE